MHSALTRIQNVFGFFTTVASFVALAIALTSLLTTSTPQLKEGSLALKNVQVVKGRPHYYSQKKEEYAHIKFDLDVDLTSLFTWNTKQVFLYITTTYPSTNPSSPPSVAIIWDAILPHPLSPTHHNQYIPPTTSKSKSTKSSKSTKTATKQHPGILKLAAQRPKYQITDPSGRIAERANATLELHWNIQPWVGALTWGSPAPADGKSGNSVLGPLALWRYMTGAGVRTAAFGFPALKDKTAGKEELRVAKGKEGHRLMG